jgi:hypothetical protein
LTGLDQSITARITLTGVAVHDRKRPVQADDRPTGFELEIPPIADVGLRQGGDAWRVSHPNGEALQDVNRRSSGKRSIHSAP